MKVKKVLVSQPRPAVIEKSPFYELSEKYNVEIAYKPFIRVVGVSLKEFRAQRVEILTHTAVIFTSRTTVDSFFHICEEARITVPETMKYICQTEAVALYLQKYIVYRKRKISFADGSFTSFIELIIKHKEKQQDHHDPRVVSDASGAGKKNPFAISPIRPVLGAASSHVGRPSLLGGA